MPDCQDDNCILMINYRAYCAAYCMGSINKDCWYIYTLNPLDRWEGASPSLGHHVHHSLPHHSVPDSYYPSTPSVFPAQHASSPSPPACSPSPPASSPSPPTSSPTCNWQVPQSASDHRARPDHRDPDV